MKRWIYPILLFTCLILVFPASAQESIWFAYLYDRQSSTLDYVNAEGRMESFSLGSNVSPYDLVFAHTRPELAYCSRNEQGNGKFIIRDIPAERNRYELELGQIAYCFTGRYNSHDTQVTVSVSYGRDISTPPYWEIFVVDAITGTIADSIPSTDPENRGFIPRIFWMDDEIIVFEEIALNSEPFGTSYALNRASRQISPYYASYTYSYERFGSEEIWIDYLPSYPASVICRPGSPNNVLMYADGSGAEQPIFYTSDWDIAGAKFINGGQQIAIRLEMPCDQPSELDTSKWIVLDRAGNISDLLTNINFEDDNSYGSRWVANSFDGYSIFESAYYPDTRSRSFSLSLVQNGIETVIWEKPAGNWDWHLVYTPEAPYQDFGDFPAVDMSNIPQVQ